ncbi:hypothetical protein HYFRA_00006095 [Hymenoscyphus fraxineus]|uniref:Uncharacterized protein n=1 Tax=Hymenoscyphus fraxineus TaxID=746836 RepID=A0A9N9LAL4_9HELO|nr:hypothetical protein HYFRA_00006095 [Hymenoscyphus fraxineus]
MAKRENSSDKLTPAEEEQIASQSMEDNLALSTIRTNAQSTSEPTDLYHREVISSLKELSFKEDEPSSDLVEDETSLTSTGSPLPNKLESKNEEEAPLYVLINTWMERMGFTLVVAELFGLRYRGDSRWTMWEETSRFEFLRLVDIKDEALANEYTKRCTETSLDDLDDPMGLGSPVPDRDQSWVSIDEYYEARREMFA